MKYGKVAILIAVILISMLAINQFLLANCGQCTDKEKPCSGQECKDKCTECKDPNCSCTECKGTCPECKDKCTECKDPNCSCEKCKGTCPECKDKCTECKAPNCSCEECKNEATFTGMFTCPCYLMIKDGEAVDTAKVKECTVKCAAAGQPLLFVDDKGVIYMAMFCCKCNVPEKDAAAMAMDKITVKGCVCEKGGFKAIKICTVEKIK